MKKQSPPNSMYFTHFPFIYYYLYLLPIHCHLLTIIGSILVPSTLCRMLVWINHLSLKDKLKYKTALKQAFRTSPTKQHIQLPATHLRVQMKVTKIAQGQSYTEYLAEVWLLWENCLFHFGNIEFIGLIQVNNSLNSFHIGTEQSCHPL